MTEVLLTLDDGTEFEIACPGVSNSNITVEFIGQRTSYSPQNVEIVQE